MTKSKRQQRLVSIDMIDGHWYVRLSGNVYRIDGWRPANIVIGTVTRRHDGVLVCSRSRDFGGCGKDAVKVEENVPLTVWLREVRAERQECEFCGDPATQVELAPVCDACHSKQGRS